MTYLLIQRGCTFYPYGRGRHVLKTPDQRQFLVTNTTKELLEALGNHTSLETICGTLSDGQGKMTAKELGRYIEERYGHLGVFTSSANPILLSTQNVQQIKGGAFLRCWDLLSSNSVNDIAARLLPFYQWFSMISMLVLIAIFHIFLYRRGTAAYTLRLAHGGHLMVLALSLFSIIAHEIGHATALLRFGARPGKIGFGLYILMPAFFADVSQVWCLPRRGRYMVDLGGVYFQQAIFVVFAAGALWWSSLELMAACVAIDTMSFLALNPVFRFDGYWLLADWLGLPKLHTNALLLLKQWAANLSWHRPASHPQLPQLKGVQSAVFVIYTALCSVFLAVTALLSIRYLRSTFTIIFHNLPIQLSRIAFSFKTHDWLTATDQVVVLLVACMFFMTAILGIYMYCNQFVSVLKNKLNKLLSAST